VTAATAPSRSYHEQEVYVRTRFFFVLAFCGRGDDPVLDDFECGDWHDPSTFIVDGRRWRCTWALARGYHSMQDRAYWDDGWWPTFETPGVKRRLRKQPWVRLWGPGSVAQAVAEGLIPA
jgi:hypothetical protein